MTLDRIWSLARSPRGIPVVVGLAVLVVVVAVLDPQSPPGVSLPLVVEVAALAVFLRAAARMTAARGVWWLLWCSLALTVLGDLVYAVQEQAFGEAPFPGWADPLYLASYVLEFAAVAWLILRRHPRASIAQVLDAAIMAIPVVAVTIVYVLVPMLVEPEPSLGMLLAFAYPLLDLAVLVSLFRLAVGGGHESRSLVLFTVAGATTLVADLVYSGLENQGVVSDVPGWLNALYAVGVVLMAAAATSSDASRVQTPGRVSGTSLSPGRLVALAAGSVALPVLILLGVGSGTPGGTRVLAAGAVAINVLIVWRSLLVMAFIDRQRQALASFARTDSLTGLPNRRSWDHEVQRAEAWADQLARPLVVAMLDLDHFKTVNDRWGHQAGDEMLRACADAWRRSLPASAYLARYGGEEFAVLLTDTDGTRVATVLEALRAATPEGMTVSVGYAQWTPGARVVDTLAAADAALYAAKAHGRNVVVGASVTFGPDEPPGEPAVAAPAASSFPLADGTLDRPRRVS